MDRLINILNSRYGCELYFRPIASLTECQKSHQCSRLPSSGIHRNGDLIFLPITLNKDFVGILEIQDSPIMTSKVLESIRDFITLLVESIYTATNRVEELKLIENQLLSEPKSTIHSNVVSLLNYKIQNYNLDQYKNPKLGLSKQKINNFTGSEAVKVPCLLESKSSDDMLRMALEVHEQSDSFAFLSFHQLETEVRNCSHSIASLGNITLFIPNIIKLTDSEIFSLVRFLKSRKPSGDPHIIAGSTIPIRTLQNQQLLPTEFLHLLNGSFFKIESSFHDYKNSGVVEHFLENLKKSWLVNSSNY